MLTGETNLMQDIQMHKDLKQVYNVFPQSQVWKNVKGLSAHWRSKGSSERPRVDCSVSCKSISGGWRVFSGSQEAEKQKWAFLFHFPFAPFRWQPTDCWAFHYSHQNLCQANSGITHSDSSIKNPNPASHTHDSITSPKPHLLMHEALQGHSDTSHNRPKHMWAT